MKRSLPFIIILVVALAAAAGGNAVYRTKKAALAAIPDEVVDDLVVHGSPSHCRARIQRYFDNGVTTSSLAILSLDPELSHRDAVRALAPNASV